MINSLSRKGKWLIIIFIAALISTGFYIFYTMPMLGDNIMKESNQSRKQFEELYGKALPTSAKNIQFIKWKPSADLYYFVAYLKFTVSKNEFVTWIKNTGMDLAGSGKAGSVYLPGVWKLEPELKLPWWDAGPDTPDNAAAQSFGENGWAVAKYERGHVYVLITDTGHAQGSPGPY